MISTINRRSNEYDWKRFEIQIRWRWPVVTIFRPWIMWGTQERWEQSQNRSIQNILCIDNHNLRNRWVSRWSQTDLETSGGLELWSGISAMAMTWVDTLVWFPIDGGKADTIELVICGRLVADLSEASLGCRGALRNLSVTEAQMAQNSLRKLSLSQP